MSSVLGSLQKDCVRKTRFVPATPQEAYFDSGRQAWVLSRYRDVQAALREKALYQASPRGETFAAGEDDAMRAEVFAQVRGEIAEVHRGRWREDMEYEARSVVRDAGRGRIVDLLGDVALPWSIAMLRKMSGAPISRRSEIASITVSLIYKKAFVLELEEGAKPLWLRTNGMEWARTEDPEHELDGLAARGEIAISKMMFLAVAQTLPAFLAKAWLALMLHPDQMEILAAEPSRMPQATAELLRYAGIVHTLHRRAVREVQIGSALIRKDDRVELRVDCANFDPDRFREPHRLDLCRPVQSHVSLGAGLHACTGAALVRQAFAATTTAFLGAPLRLFENQPIVWMGDSTLRWPLAVWVQGR